MLALFFLALNKAQLNVGGSLWRIIQPSSEPGFSTWCKPVFSWLNNPGVYLLRVLRAQCQLDGRNKRLASCYIFYRAFNNEHDGTVVHLAERSQIPKYKTT